MQRINRNLVALVLLTFIALYSDQNSQTNAASNNKRGRNNDVPPGLNCTNSNAIIDDCSSQATFSFTTSTNLFPTTALELKKSCDRMQEGIKCLKQYNKCLVSVGRRTVNAFTSGRSRHSKSICANINSQKSIDFYKGFECVMKNKRSKFDTSERILIQSLQYAGVHTELPWEERFHQACCAASSYTAKVGDDASPGCERAKPALTEMFDLTIGDLLEIACPQSKKLEELCTKLPKLDLPKTWVPISLTKAALDLITSLEASDPKKDT